MEKQREGRATKTVYVFILTGPLVGLLAGLTAQSPVMLTMLVDPRTVGIALMIAYVIGGLPAIVTGFAYALLPARWRNPIVSALIGLTLSGLVALLMNPRYLLLPMVAAGGAAGLVSALCCTPLYRPKLQPVTNTP